VPQPRRPTGLEPSPLAGRQLRRSQRPRVEGCERATSRDASYGSQPKTATITADTRIAINMAALHHCRPRRHQVIRQMRTNLIKVRSPPKTLPADLHDALAQSTERLRTSLSQVRCHVTAGHHRPGGSGDDCSASAAAPGSVRTREGAASADAPGADSPLLSPQTPSARWCRRPSQFTLPRSASSRPAALLPG
jgi:hypothetical protein